MKVADRDGHLGSIEDDSRLLEPPLALEYLVELSSSNEGHHEVEPEVVLEEVLHTDEERVVALEHDVLLQNRVLHLVVLDQDVLPNGLDCKELLSRLELSKEHLSKGSSSDNHEEVEILKGDYFITASLFLLHEESPSQFFFLLVSQHPLEGSVTGVLDLLLLHFSNVVGQVVVLVILIAFENNVRGSISFDLLLHFMRSLLVTRPNLHRGPVFKPEISRVLVMVFLFFGIFNFDFPLRLNLLISKPVLGWWFVVEGKLIAASLVRH